MNKKVILTIVAVVVLFAIATTVYIFNGKTSDVNSPESNKGTQISQTPSSEEPNKDNSSNPADDVDEANKVTLEEYEKNNSNEKEEPRIKDDNSIVSIEGYTKEELLSAGEFVSDYIYETHANSYFLGGEWYNNGSDMKILKGVLGKYYSNEVLADLDKYEGKSETQEFAEKVSGMIPYFAENKAYSPSPFCSVDNKKTKTSPNEQSISETMQECPLNLDISEIIYESTKNDKGDYVLDMYFTTNATYPLFSKELNKDASTDAEYKYRLSLTKLSDEESDDSKWEISSYAVDVSYSKIKELKG